MTPSFFADGPFRIDQTMPMPIAPIHSIDAIEAAPAFVIAPLILPPGEDLPGEKIEPHTPDQLAQDTIPAN
jgi:hypothetical protein